MVRTGWVWKGDFCYTGGIFGKMSAEGLKSWISDQEVLNKKVRLSPLFMTTLNFEKISFMEEENCLEKKQTIVQINFLLMLGQIIKLSGPSQNGLKITNTKFTPGVFTRESMKNRKSFDAYSKLLTGW